MEFRYLYLWGETGFCGGGEKVGSVFRQGELVPDESNQVDRIDQLWSRYFESRSIEDRNRLVLFYAPLVKLVANRVARGVSSFQTVEETCSSGHLGLINAVERFDPTEGFLFATYATIRIQGAIIDELRRDDILPKRMRARVRTYQVARESLEADLHRTPTLRELAAHLETTMAEIMEIDDLAVLSSYLVPLSMVGEDQTRIAFTSSAEPGEAAVRSSMRDTIKAALMRITERQRQVLVLHYLEGFQKSEIAETLGIDRSRVTQLVQQGLRNLRMQLEDQRGLGLDLE
ncbi:MAG: sigma-70 family RNA polymerase sigma factor [Actinomycetota bacterium]|nr:sigma-70 family RNA polymerase sigma factor [Actinomycetota bacterium]